MAPIPFSTQRLALIVAYLAAFLSTSAVGVGLGNLLEPLAHTAEISEESAESTRVERRVFQEIRENYPLTQDDLLLAFERDLVQRYRIDGRLQLKLLDEWRPIELERDAWKLEILRYPVGNLSRLETFHCRLQLPGRRSLTRQFTLRLEVPVDVLFPVRNVNRGTPFSRSDFEVATVNALEHPAGLVPAETALNHYQLNRTVTSRQPLRWADLQELMLIEKGRTVTVRARSGMLTVTAIAIALQDGARDDVILLRNTQSHAKIHARVIDENTAEINL